MGYCGLAITLFGPRIALHSAWYLRRLAIMLRITTSSANERVTLKLEGKLSGPWVEEFERCWRISSDIYKDKTVVVDLSSVTFVDAVGKKLLCSISQEGGQLIGSGLL